jgi:hypothetical protein
VRGRGERAILKKDVDMALGCHDPHETTTTRCGILVEEKEIIQPEAQREPGRTRA